MFFFKDKCKFLTFVGTKYLQHTSTDKQNIRRFNIFVSLFFFREENEQKLRYVQATAKVMRCIYVTEQNLAAFESGKVYVPPQTLILQLRRAHIQLFVC